MYISLYDLGQQLFRDDLQSTSKQRKIRQLEFHQHGKLFYIKANYKENKKETHRMAKIIINHVSDKGLVSKIRKIFLTTQ